MLTREELEEMTGKAWQEIVPPFAGMVMSGGEVLREPAHDENCRATFSTDMHSFAERYRDYHFPSVTSEANWNVWTRSVAGPDGSVTSTLVTKPGRPDEWRVSIGRAPGFTHELFACALLGATLRVRMRTRTHPSPHCDRWWEVVSHMQSAPMADMEPGTE